MLPYGVTGNFLRHNRHIATKTAIFRGSKLQFFDKGEKRFVLFEEFKQYNLRDKLNIDKLWFCKAKWSHKTTNSLFASPLIFYTFITLYARQAIKSFLRAFFQKSENLYLTIFPINLNLSFKTVCIIQRGGKEIVDVKCGGGGAFFGYLNGIVKGIFCLNFAAFEM